MSNAKLVVGRKGVPCELPPAAVPTRVHPSKIAQTATALAFPHGRSPFTLQNGV